MRLVCGESKILSPCHCPGILLLGLALQCSVLMTVGIRLENVTIPSVGFVGQSASLVCQWSLTNDSLYSLKWYKDGHEFYRYLPSSRPQISTFSTDGVQVDNQDLNNANRVTLRNLNLNSSGLYRCEVSSESPIFQTLQQDGRFTAIIPPTPVNPHLSKFPQTVYMHDTLSGNCTSYRSYPVANLSFYINDRKWTGSNVTTYPPVMELDREGREVWTSVMGLRVFVDNNFFNKGVIRIKCVASILDKEWETTKKITHQNKNYQPPMYSSAKNHSSASGIRWWWAFGLTWFPLLPVSTLYCSAFELTLLFYAACTFNGLVR